MSCLVKVSSLPSLLFLISLSDNSIYNIIPDTLSHLSNCTVKWKKNANDPEAVPPAIFRKIMKHLLGFIEKEQQLEALVVKLCTRYSKVS